MRSPDEVKAAVDHLAGKIHPPEDRRRVRPVVTKAAERMERLLGDSAAASGE